MTTTKIDVYPGEGREWKLRFKDTAGNPAFVSDGVLTYRLIRKGDGENLSSVLVTKLEADRQSMLFVLPGSFTDIAEPKTYRWVAYWQLPETEPRAVGDITFNIMNLA